MADKPTLDGFHARRPNTRAQVTGGMGFNDEEVQIKVNRHAPTVLRPSVPETSKAAPKEAFQVPTGLSQGQASTGGVHRSELEQSLRSIDDEASDPGVKHGRRSSGDKKRFFTRKKVIISSIILVLLIGLGVTGYVLIKGVLASNSIFKGDIFGLIQQQPLQKDANGRSNVLLFGTSEDDPGHEAAYLTDSIMVLSIDQDNKNAYMVSVPRDLYVKYDGLMCVPGTAGKINVYYNCVNDDMKSADAERQRQIAMRRLVGNIVGMDIQYSVHVNYTVVRDVVGAIGPITVDILGSNGAPGVMDSNFDWKCKSDGEYNRAAQMKKSCPPNGHFIEYPNGPATIDAEHALYLAQARGDSYPTYGLARSNYDRELNQQKIIKAIKEKALNSGTLTDLTKVSGLIDALGNNLRTNFETKEVRTLVSLAKDIPSDAIKSISLVDAQPALFGNDGNNNVIPAAGTYDYTAIQAFIRKSINATGIEKEAAHVVVLNASGIAGQAKTEGDKLTALGMVLDSVGNASTADYKTNTIYQISKSGSDGKPNTVKKLQSLYGAAPVKSALPAGITPGADTEFVIIVTKPSVDTSTTTANQ